MSEGYDSQKKLSGDFRKSLQERLGKINPCRTELITHEQQRLAKLEEIAERLRHGKNLQNCQMQI